MELKSGYRQTEIGLIPEDWDIMQLSRCLRRIDQGWSPVAAKGEISPDQWAVLTLSSVKQGIFNATAIKSISGSVKVPDKTEIRDGDLLLTRSNTRELVGDVCIVEGARQKTIMPDLIYRLVTNPAHIDCRFLMFQLLSPIGRRQIERDAHGSSGSMPKVSQRHIRSWVVAAPPTAEQTAIAAALSDVDALIITLDRLISKKRDIKQAAMQELLTGKRRLPGFEKAGGFKKTEIGVMPKEWNVAPLQEACTFINGRAYKLSEWEKSGTPVIRLQNLTGGDEYYYSTLELPSHQYCYLGDLLYMWSATFGPHIWNGEKAIFHYHIWKVEPRPHLTNKIFLYYKLDEITHGLTSRASNGGTMLHVTKERMEKTQIALPPLPEQHAIAVLLTDMDAEIRLLMSKHGKIKLIKQGMMQELLTGRIRLV